MTRFAASVALALSIALCAAGCGSGVASRCWGDAMGVNFCTHFVQQHFWTGAVAVTDARYPVAGSGSGLSISDELSTTTGIASALGGSIAGEAASHVVIAP